MQIFSGDVPQIVKEKQDLKELGECIVFDSDVEKLPYTITSSTEKIRERDGHYLIHKKLKFSPDFIKTSYFQCAFKNFPYEKFEIRK